LRTKEELVIIIRLNLLHGKRSSLQHSKTALKSKLENIEGAIKNGQSGDTGNMGYTTQRNTKHNMCWTSLYANKHK